MTASILIAIDGASPPDALLALAARHARGLSAPVEVICVIDPDREPETVPQGLPGFGEAGAGQIRLQADQAVRAAVGQLQAAGIEAAGHVAAGEPGHVICTYAGNRGCQLIVLGHRYRHWFAKLRESSVCHAVIEHATCPVLVLTPHCATS